MKFESAINQLAKECKARTLIFTNHSVHCYGVTEKFDNGLVELFNRSKMRGRIIRKNNHIVAEWAGIISCPKCIGGQLYVEPEHGHDWVEVCLQCGYSKLIPDDDPRIPRSQKIRRACEIESHLQSASVFNGSMVQTTKWYGGHE